MKIYQYMDPSIPIKQKYWECIDQVISYKPTEVGYELIRHHPFKVDKTNDCRYESDLVRLNLAIENPNMVWLDSDITIKEWFNPPNNGKPYFFSQGPYPLECVFYVNGNIQFFKNLLNIYYNYKQFQTLGWICSAIMTFYPNDFCLIPEGYFNHCNYKGLI